MLDACELFLLCSAQLTLLLQGVLRLPQLHQVLLQLQYNSVCHLVLVQMLDVLSCLS